MISALIGAAPQLGGAGVLVLVLGLLIRREAQTNERHSSELARVNEAHDGELRELREEITALREQVAELNRKVDEERSARRAAEDQAAAAGRHRRGEWPA